MSWPAWKGLDIYCVECDIVDEGGVVLLLGAPLLHIQRWFCFCLHVKSM